jgi:hypothetical protein
VRSSQSPRLQEHIWPGVDLLRKVFSILRFKFIKNELTILIQTSTSGSMQWSSMNHCKNHKKRLICKSVVVQLLQNGKQFFRKELIFLARLVNSPCKAINLCSYLFAQPKFSIVMWIGACCFVPATIRSNSAIWRLVFLIAPWL